MVEPLRMKARKASKDQIVVVLYTKLKNLNFVPLGHGKVLSL